MSEPDDVLLQALLLADHVYRDQATGKYVVAGTFHQVNLAAFPGSLSRSVGAFVAVRAPAGPHSLTLQFVEVASGEVLADSARHSVTSPDDGSPMVLAVEIPPLPFPREGDYLVRLRLGGRVLGEAPLAARCAAVEG